MVLELTSPSADGAEAAGALSEAVTAEAASRGYFHVISSREIATLLGVERGRQLLGDCSDDESSCLAEISGALGARFILSGSVTRLGEVWQLSLQMLDSERAQTLGRSTRLAGDVGALRQAIPFAVAEATGTPLPPPRSRWLQYSLVALGGTLAIAGGIVGQDALSEARALQKELDRGRQNPGTLSTFDDYQRQNAELRSRSRLAVGGLAAGAALVAAGVLTLPEEAGRGGGGRTARVLPTGRGAALIVTFD